MQNDDILRKIKKCLRLAESSNEHEAAAAIRQAQALMTKHGLNHDDVAVSDIKEASTRAGGVSRPAKWEQWLCLLIAQAFNCKAIHSRLGSKAHWVFIGREANPEIAGHAFAQLYRQMKRARQQYIDEQCQFLGKAQKSKRADMFCRGWLASVSKQVDMHAGGKDDEVIAAYMKKQHDDLGQLGSTDRHKGKRPTMAEAQAFVAGRDAGADAALHRGVAGDSAPQLELQP